jgi:hypothetical protein
VDNKPTKGGKQEKTAVPASAKKAPNFLMLVGLPGSGTSLSFSPSSPHHLVKYFSSDNHYFIYPNIYYSQLW